MGWKDWVYGDLVSAADFQSLVQDQTVQRYADSATRSSTLGSAVAEGMVSYLDDTNAVEVYNGSAWSALGAGSGNAIINGAFDIWQRGTSFTTSVYTADRWAAYVADGTVTNTRQSFTLGTAPVAGYEGTYFWRTVVSGQTLSSAASFLSQKVEDVRSFAGQTVTLSFWAKAASGTPKIGLEYTQGFGTGGSPSATTNTNFGSPTITTSWARYTTTVAIPSISGKTLGTNNDSYLEFGFWFSAGSNFNARSGSIGIQNNTIDIWGVQLEAGSSATPFKRNAPSIQGELAACQRYYKRFTAELGNSYSMFATGYSNTSSQAKGFLSIGEMRIPPSSLEYSGVAFVDFNGTVYPWTSVTMDTSQISKYWVHLFGSVSGATAGRAGQIVANNNSTGYIGVSSEL